MDMTITSAVLCEVATVDATSSSKSGSRHARQTTAHPSRRSLEASTSTGASIHEFESARLSDIKRMASVEITRRSVSCFELGSVERRYRLIRIGDGNEELQRLAVANVTQLVETASSSAAADANNAVLARKALRFRKIWTQENENECTSPLC